MKDVDFGSLAFRVLDSIQPFKYLTVLILPKSPSPYPKKFLELFLNRSKNPKNYFHAKPFGKSFNHIGNRPFFKFQSQKGKIDKIIDTTLHFRTKTSDFFFFLSPAKRSILLPTPNPSENHLLILGRGHFSSFRARK